MSDKEEAVRLRLASRDDRGDTLIEVLIALVILALAVVPVVGLTFEMLSGAAEHRSLATLNSVMKGFAEVAKAQIELAPSSGGPSFNNCSGTVDYKLLSLPTPRVAAPGAAVTVFATGFSSGVPLGTFTVKVGGKTATKTAKQSQSASGNEMGNMQLTFLVPGTLSGPQTIHVSDGLPTQTVTSTATTELTVTSSATTSKKSTLAGFTLGVKRIRYWNAGAPTETTALTDCKLNGGIQLVTLHGRAGHGAGDTLTFDLRNPTPANSPLATPSVTVSATPVFAALPPSGTPDLVFTAVVTPPAGNQRPIRAITWSITEAGTATSCPTAAGPTTGTDNASVYTCTIALSGSSPTGRYAATAAYPAVAPTSTTPGNNAESWVGFASVYGPDGGGSVSVAPTSAPTNTTGEVFTFTYTAGHGGMNGGELLVVLPHSSTPKKAWTKPQTSNAAAAGYTTAKIGTTTIPVSTTGSTIEVFGLTLNSGTTLSIAYGTGGGASGVTTPLTKGTYLFTIEQSSIPGGSPTALSSSPLKVKVT